MRCDHQESRVHCNDGESDRGKSVSATCHSSRYTSSPKRLRLWTYVLMNNLIRYQPSQQARVVHRSREPDPRGKSEVPNRSCPCRAPTEWPALSSSTAAPRYHRTSPPQRARESLVVIEFDVFPESKLRSAPSTTPSGRRSSSAPDLETDVLQNVYLPRWMSFSMVMRD